MGVYKFSESGSFKTDRVGRKNMLAGEIRFRLAIVAVGGEISEDADYRYHTFNSTGTFSVSSNPNNDTIDYLVVAGGGPGGYGNGGGGGAGGFISRQAQPISSGSYPVVVGAGGVAGTSPTNGSNSEFLSNISIGGGRGGGHSMNPRSHQGYPGGSGGGADINYLSTRPLGGSGTSGQGNKGGDSYGQTDNPRNNGGGGGAGSAGLGNSSRPDGGSGLQWLNGSIYAGGGGAGRHSSDRSGYGPGFGSSGGGNGASSGVNSTAGLQNTGSGGGGGFEGSQISGNNGGSGVVVIRYPI
jgi:hypothetical protein